MRLVEMTPFLPMRLIEHPGHSDQKVHGRKGAGGGDRSAQIAKLDAELRTIRGAERIVAIDSKTGKVKLDKGNDGLSVEITLADDVAMRGTIASHNHPTGWDDPAGTVGRNGSGPSQQDLMTAWRAGPDDMRVVGPTTTWSVKKGTDPTWGQVTEIRNSKWPGNPNAPGPGQQRAAIMEQKRQIALADIDSRVRVDFTDDIGNGRKTVEAAQSMHHEEVLRRAAQEFGWEVTVTHERSFVDPMNPPDTPEARWENQFWGDSSLPGMGQQSQVGESEERGLARELIATAVRLMEHPGHGNQKVHGRRSGVDVSGTQLAGISEKTRAKIKAKADALGLPSSEAMAVSIGAAYDRASPGARAKGKEWYSDTHKEAQAMAEANGQTLEGTAAVLAICSPTRQWASNMAVAHEISSVVGKNEKFEVSAELGKSARPPLEPGSYKPSDLTSGQLAWTHPQFKNAAIAQKYGLTGKEARSGRDHYGQISTSVDVLRGDKTPDQALTGVKTRNFYNNIYDPRAGGVTVDDWAYKVALTDTPVSVRYQSSTGPATYTGPASGAPYGALGGALQGSPTVKAEGYKAGVYPVVGEAYAIAAKKAGILPQEMQAIVWESARETGVFGGD